MNKYKIKKEKKTSEEIKITNEQRSAAKEKYMEIVFEAGTHILLYVNCFLMIFILLYRSSQNTFDLVTQFFVDGIRLYVALVTENILAYAGVIISLASLSIKQLLSSDKSSHKKFIIALHQNKKSAKIQILILSIGAFFLLLAGKLESIIQNFEIGNDFNKTMTLVLASLTAISILVYYFIGWLRNHNKIDKDIIDKKE